MWGNHVARGTGVIDEQRPAWAVETVWGGGLNYATVWIDEFGTIIWGNALVDDNIVWGNNIVWGWGLVGMGLDPLNPLNIVWSNIADDNIVWGNLADDNIVWGNSLDDDNIVWGNTTGDADGMVGTPTVTVTGTIGYVRRHRIQTVVN